MEKCFLGVDIGGTMTKAVLFTQAGKMLSLASAPTPVITPREGYNERDMGLLFEVTCTVISQSVEKSGINSADIAAIGCTGHGKGLYPWGDGKQAYNAIASTDSRAAQIVRQWEKEGVVAKAREKTLQGVLASQPVAILKWLKENERAAYDNIKYVFEAKDFIRFMLTGEAFAEVTDYSGTSLMNLLTARFDRELLELFGIPEIFEKLPPLKNSYEPCGKITKAVADITGLKEGTVVCGGMFDIDACAIAMDVSSPEKVCIITGTWSINEYIAEKPVKSDTTLNSFFCLPGYYLIEESSPTSAGNLEWFIDLFMTEEKRLAKGKGISIYKVIDEMVETLKPEDSAVLFVPFLYGSNMAGCDAASFTGLKYSHGKKHLLRAIFEGVVFSHMLHLERLFEHRGKPDAIRLAGGAANSAVWAQMFADAVGIPMEVVSVPELGTLGCAMAGAVAAGVYRDYKEAAKNMVEISGTFHPNADKHTVYREKYKKYMSALTAGRIH